MESNKYCLVAKHITFGYEKGNTVLDDVSLSIRSKEITTLIGANGCGKSTLFHLLTGRLKPNSGKVLLNDIDIKDIKRKDFSKKIAVVNQYNTAPDDLTVRRLVEMGRTPYRNILSYGNSDEDEQAVNKALKFTDTLKYADRPISSLSGGQKQRVWLALALAQSPEILLLDEITTYLDIHYQYEILNLIKELNSQMNLTVVLVLHDINQAIEFSDNAIIMNDGKVLAAGVADEIINKTNLDTAFRVNTCLTRLNGRKYCCITN
jgi:iron complex transport system ATP-binding protein